MQQLSQPGSCCDTQCDEVVNVSVPGPQGAAGTNGTNGTDGTNAFSELAAAFVQPAVGANVVVEVLSSSWASIGQTVFVEGGGDYEVIAKTDSTHMTLENLGHTNSVAPASNVPLGSQISPSGEKGATGSVPGDVLLASNNLSDLADATLVLPRANLGLGALAVLNTVGTAQIDALAVTDAKLALVLNLSANTINYPADSVLKADLEQHLRDLLPQAMAVFTGGTGARPFAANYNIPIGGITQVSTGIYDVVFANAVPFGTLHITFGLGTTLGTPNVLYRAGYSGVGVNGFRIHVFDGANAAADPPSLSFLVYSVLNP